MARLFMRPTSADARRRRLLLLAASGTLMPLSLPAGFAQTSSVTAPLPHMNTRPIPSTGDPLRVVGCGTWRPFDVGDNREAQAALAEVLRILFDNGGSVIDSSPMYGSSEAGAGGGLPRTG